VSQIERLESFAAIGRRADARAEGRRPWGGRAEGEENDVPFFPRNFSISSSRDRDYQLARVEFSLASGSFTSFLKKENYKQMSRSHKIHNI
jgi:hypothetical protein